jgi:hypothetical protein
MTAAAGRIQQPTRQRAARKYLCKHFAFAARMCGTNSQNCVPTG